MTQDELNQQAHALEAWLDAYDPELSETVLYDSRSLRFRTILYQTANELFFDYAMLRLPQKPGLATAAYVEKLRSQAENIQRILEFMQFVLSVFGDGPSFEPSPFTITLAEVLNTPNIIDSLRAWFTHGSLYHFGVIERFLTENFEEQKVSAAKSHLPPLAMAEAYLKHTPFLNLMHTPVPLPFKQEDRFAHMHVIAGSRHGKTTLLHNLFLHDIKHDNSIVVIDPHSTLVRKLYQENLGVDDRLIVIDPRDTAVALNPFAVNRTRLSGYDELLQEQITAGVVQTLLFLFDGMFGGEISLTGKMQTFLRPCIDLLLKKEEVTGEVATFIDLLKLIENPSEYEPVIRTLPEMQQLFFAKEFRKTSHGATMDAIRYRVSGITSNKTLTRIFTAPTSFDFFTAMNEGKIILIDGAYDLLKNDADVLAQLCTTLVFQAVMERGALPENSLKPTYVYVDEASYVMSANVEKILAEMGKYKAGLILSHQGMSQAAAAAASIESNTLIKFAGGTSATDASWMARNMRCDADFILNQPRFRFAAFIRGATPTAVTIKVPLPPQHGKRSPEELQAFLAENQKRISEPHPRPKPDAALEEIPPSPSPQPNSNNGWDEWN